MNTLDFMTKTEIIPMDNLNIENKWLIALDIGYSSVKIFSPACAAMLPSFARRITSPSFGKMPKDHIRYIDAETGDEWFVGQAAYDSLTSGDMTDSVSELYGRNHYFSPTFTVIARVGLALALTSNSNGGAAGKEICLQTGLPSKYVEEDRKHITEALSGRHRFAVQLGNAPLKRFDIFISPMNVNVIPQPAGTLYSICYKDNGKSVPEADRYFTTSGLVMDPGFGTLDTFPIHGKGDTYETHNDLGMKRVMEETISLINNRYGINLSITAMQRCLKSGTVKTFNRKTLSTTEYPIADLLEESNKKVCFAALEQILNSYNYLMDYSYLVITGGTGDAWKEIIKERLKNLADLEIVSGNRNSSLPMAYSNVRGYYLYMYKRLIKDK